MKKEKIYNNKGLEGKEYKRIKRVIKQEYNENKIDNNLSLDRVFIDYSKMIN